MARNGWIRTAGDNLVPAFDNRTPPGDYITDNPALWDAHNILDAFVLRPSGARVAPAAVATWAKVAGNRYDVTLIDGRSGYIVHGAFETIMAGAQ